MVHGHRRLMGYKDLYIIITALGGNGQRKQGASWVEKVFGLMEFINW